LRLHVPISRMLKRTSIARTKPDAAPQISPRSRVSHRERLESEAEIATYIAQLSAEMSTMAGSARLDLLAYFLTLARMEAETIMRRPIMDEFGASE
jgi:hypothetical protein